VFDLLVFLIRNRKRFVSRPLSNQGGHGAASARGEVPEAAMNRSGCVNNDVETLAGSRRARKESAEGAGCVRGIIAAKK
jgi:hypothetical protein